jgi:hypothetical protein
MRVTFNFQTNTTLTNEFSKVGWEEVVTLQVLTILCISPAL